MISSQYEICTQVAGAVDVVPTVAALAGAALDGAHPVDGVDLGPALFEGKTIDRELYWKLGRTPVLRAGKWKLVGDALYDLENDPGERTNVSAVNAAVVQSLRARINAVESAIASRKPVPRP